MHNRTIALLDVDKTSLLSFAGEPDFYNDNLFNFLRDRNVKDVYIFSNTNAGSIAERLRLVKYLQAKGFHVLGVVSPMDIRDVAKIYQHKVQFLDFMDVYDTESNLEHERNKEVQNGSYIDYLALEVERKKREFDEKYGEDRYVSSKDDFKRVEEELDPSDPNSLGCGFDFFRQLYESEQLDVDGRDTVFSEKLKDMYARAGIAAHIKEEKVLMFRAVQRKHPECSLVICDDREHILKAIKQDQANLPAGQRAKFATLEVKDKATDGVEQSALKRQDYERSMNAIDFSLTREQLKNLIERRTVVLELFAALTEKMRLVEQELKQRRSLVQSLSRVFEGNIFPPNDIFSPSRMAQKFRQDVNEWADRLTTDELETGTKRNGEKILSYLGAQYTSIAQSMAAKCVSFIQMKGNDSLSKEAKNMLCCEFPKMLRDIMNLSQQATDLQAFRDQVEEKFNGFYVRIRHFLGMATLADLPTSILNQHILPLLHKQSSDPRSKRKKGEKGENAVQILHRVNSELHQKVNCCTFWQIRNSSAMLSEMYKLFCLCYADNATDEKNSLCEMLNKNFNLIRDFLNNLLDKKYQSLAEEGNSTQKNFLMDQKFLSEFLIQSNGFFVKVTDYLYKTETDHFCQERGIDLAKMRGKFIDKSISDFIEFLCGMMHIKDPEERLNWLKNERMSIDSLNLEKNLKWFSSIPSSANAVIPML